ncbi:hypothetical protein OESDEN_01371 [Oesophagostomum dentatum]|uniref:Uncharacterized protein n=1 Tax=Oesophagostomum dentatum TaxID=61180 RepID=A0A0B1TTD6_OESDE|nr:hypothetical protein OESDEN_01371 [Oesophagostomum dentatum]
MAQLTARTVLSTLTKRPLIVTATAGRRSLATEASPEDYGYYPDPLEHATGREKKMLLARLAGDDVGLFCSAFDDYFKVLCYNHAIKRYEPKVYYRAEASTKERPNLVPSHFPDRIIGCMCEFSVLSCKFSDQLS